MNASPSSFATLRPVRFVPVLAPVPHLCLLVGETPLEVCPDCKAPLGEPLGPVAQTTEYVSRGLCRPPMCFNLRRPGESAPT